MRIDSTSLPTIPEAKTLGRAVREKVFSTGSVETPDILELSSRGRLASALGPVGFEALQSLAGEVDSGRLESFLSDLFGTGGGSDSANDLLSLLTSAAKSPDVSAPGDLFEEIEKRGVSGNLDYLNRLDGLFNLGHRNLSPLFSAGEDLSNEEFGLYLESVGTLLKNGVVGTLTIEYRGEPKTVFLENEFGTDYSRSRLYPNRIGSSGFPV